MTPREGGGDQAGASDGGAEHADLAARFPSQWAVGDRRSASSRSAFTTSATRSGSSVPSAVPMAWSPRRLADAYTVVTYDRRGLARGTVDDPRRPVTMAAHVDDAHRLLAAVTDEPAFMLGCGFGALIGLHLGRRASRAAGRARRVREPVAPALLPAAERARHEEELAHLQRVRGRRAWPRRSRRSPTSSASTPPARPSPASLRTR
ncbi:hypothetical protein Airi01_073130 [Actinoallomurus iriomotensis]|uniref:AB hydrolase-1 domain-containing protein n=1 Tax=Actinoallomurus iriomotensis TaxID=478107 RepID=A0A9W6RMN6_9ACTN|nr:hypothetical protein Airi01_073130 [Actinoallomurus iriomotensis]